MDTSLTRALTRLPKGALLRVRAAHGKGIAVFQGQAWVTQDRDTRDVLVGAGESFALDRPGTAVVQALDDTRLLVFETRPQGSSAAVRGVDSMGDLSQARRDVEVPEIGPPTSYELYLQARRMRSDAIGEGILALLEASRLAWSRLWARA